MTRSVLIVEDEKISSLFLVHLLTRLGYGISGTASTGEDAIRLAEASKPDLVVMDVGLKGRMNGVQAARIIHQRQPTPVLFVTAYKREEIEKHALLPMKFEILEKPILEHQLAEALERMLRPIAQT